jgi:hypothetical protein
MFFFYFNKLGWVGSILVSVALTAALIPAVRVPVVARLHARLRASV